jgi:response regulator RpfG family c-di-GMP phosphodiesterase
MPSEATAFDPNSVNILIVDNDPVILSVLKEQLEPEGYQITITQDTNQALAAMQKQEFCVIMADQEMSGMTGLQFLSKVKEGQPSAIRLLISSTLGLKELLDAVKSNLIHRFITKPWLREELLIILRNSAACQLSRSQLSSAAGRADQASAERAGADSESTGEPSSETDWTTDKADAAVEAFIKMLGAFHPNLGNTAIRTAALCKTAAQVLGLPPGQAQSLVWAAALHDVAMVGVERNIVRRWVRSPDKCTDEELAIVKRHPIESQDMLGSIPIFQEAAAIVRGHHENWDGTGYPDRLKAEMIPWLSRVLAVAIYFCSRFQNPVQLMNEIQGLSEQMFDPQAVEAIGRAVPLTQLPRGEREILLIELQPGMVLARDIYNTSGVLVIAKGKELTTAWINKIMAINNSTPINPLALVYC